MQWLLLAFAGVVGVLNSIQAGSNTTLNKATGSPLWSAAIVFAVALTTAVTAALVTGQRPQPGFAAQLPWWAWIGGMLGATYVLAMVVVADKVGAALFMAITVTAAIVTSLGMDHFGLLGFEVHRAGLGRLAGGASIILGLLLIARY